MTKEERLQAAEAYVKNRYGWISKEQSEVFQSHFLAGAEAEAESKWISVEDRMPEPHKRVTILEFTDGLSEPNVLQGSYEINRWRIFGGQTAEKVSHWQPIPAPPLNQQ